MSSKILGLYVMMHSPFRVLLRLCNYQFRANSRRRSLPPIIGLSKVEVSHLQLCHWPKDSHVQRRGTSTLSSKNEPANAICMRTKMFLLPQANISSDVDSHIYFVDNY